MSLIQCPECSKGGSQDECGIGSAFTGNLHVIGLLAAIVILGGMVYMLCRPYKEATELTRKSGHAERT